MANVLICPRKYVQGRNALAEAGKHLKILGKKPLLLWDGTVKGIVADTVLASLAGEGLEPVEVDFQGDCTRKEVDRIVAIIEDSAADIAVGLGGGKTLDTAKAAAIETGIRIVTCPTIASNDSPTSAASVWYDDDGNFTHFDCWPFNPDLVLVDSLVISRGPARALAAGMGDALATWVEAKVALETGAGNIAGGVSTLAAMAIAELGYEVLLEHGVEAKRAVESDALTPSVEKVIEANILHSGLGFESGGLATAHWSLPDPSFFEGTDDQRLAFARFVAEKLKAALEQFVALPIEDMTPEQVRAKLQELAPDASGFQPPPA